MCSDTTAAHNEKKKLRIPWTLEEERYCCELLFSKDGRLTISINRLLKEGLDKFGKEYKKLESYMLGTRSIAQIKYYIQKLTKGDAEQSNTPSLSPPLPSTAIKPSPQISTLSSAIPTAATTAAASSVNLPSHKTLWSDNEHESFLSALVPHFFFKKKKKNSFIFQTKGGS